MYSKVLYSLLPSIVSQGGCASSNGRASLSSSARTESTMSYLIAAISNAGGAPEQAYRKLQNAGSSNERPFAGKRCRWHALQISYPCCSQCALEIYKFEVPSLTVGTLDTLMNLSDDLGKTDALVESTVRKIEKTAQELGSHEGLAVGGVPSSRYIQQFAWDSAKYPSRRPLKELVSLITTGTASVEEELKQLMQSFGDKTAALQEKKRQSGGNMLSTDWNDVLNDQIMSRVKVVDSEYLKTVFVAIPKGTNDSFEAGVYNLGSDMVGYGGPDWEGDASRLGEPESYGTQIDRRTKVGSPVVPGSLQQVHADDDSILYAMTLLKGQSESGFYENNEYQAGKKIDFIEEFANVCREKRYVYRDFTWDPSQAAKSATALEQLQVEVDGMNSALLRWCKNHYGDAFVAWMHIKVIRVFVESVLRYGLPVDFTAVLYKVKHNKESELIASLDKELGTAVDAKDDEEDDDEDFHDFVLLKFDP